MGTKEEDYVIDMFITCSHDYIMFFTNRGRVYWLKAYRVPVGGRHAKGKPIVNLLEHLEEGEKVVATMPVKAFDEESNLVFATKKGTIKKTKLSAYSHIRQSGIIAIKLEEDDELVETALTDGTREVVFATKKGLAARFDEKDARSIGRGTYGVRGVRLKPEDEVVSMAIVGPKDQLLSVTETGFGKRSLVDDYRKIKRGGKGVITIKTGGRNGDVISVMKVTDEDELIITSVKGMVIRMPVQGISLQGRATMGVRVMRLKESDKIAAIARLVGSIEEERVVEAGRTITSCPAPNGDPNGGDEQSKGSEKDEPDEE